MSNTIDQRVVEMRFDNRNFEQNVSHTMSTLDKFKAKLNLSDATKGFGNLSTAAKQVDMNGLASGVETVRARFSALEVIGVTALARITNQAMATGERMIKALTIEPIMTGFKEYETQMNAVQTILANTESKGSTIHDVNEALDELNRYADLTIYNFTEMTRNIGTFTAAGVDLDTSVSAIQGIANLAAVSGSTSQQASTAMYQLSQALAAGTVKLQDWNSVVNAGMGGEVFQTALKRTASVMGTNVDALIEKYGSFRESLSRGQWLTTEVLTETLKQFTMAAEEGKDQWKAYQKELMAKGYTEQQAYDILKMANTATDAATKVKTFTQLWDVMKESVQSGWAQTWKLIIGDFEQAKALLSPLAKFFTDIIDKISSARNNLLAGAMGNPFSDLISKVTGMADSVGEAADKLEDYSQIVDEIISGKWGSGAERMERLTEAGYDYAHAQNLVNEKLGSSVRRTTKYNKAQDKLNDTQSYTIDQLAELEVAQLSQMGYSSDQIRALRELKVHADDAGKSISDFIKDMEGLDGRTLLVQAITNVGKSLVLIIQSIAQAWRDAFPPMESLELYNMIAALNKFSQSLVLSEESADNIRRTLAGVFAILDVILTIVGGPIKMAFKAFGQLLGVFDLSFLEFTAVLGDAAVLFRDWLDSVLDFTPVFEWLVDTFTEGYDIVSKWCENLNIGKIFEDARYYWDEFVNAVTGKFSIADKIEKIKDVFNKLVDDIKIAFASIGDTDVMGDLVNGWWLGLKSGAKKIWDECVSFATMIITKVCDVLGIESPSTVFFEIGENIMAGLFEGIKSFDWSKISALLWTISSFLPTAPILNVIAALANMGAAFGDTVMDGFKETLSSASSIGGSLITGFVNGFAEGAKAVWNVVVSFATTILNKIKDVLGIHSPSTEFFEIAKMCIKGFVNGIVELGGLVLEGVVALFKKVVDLIKDIDLGTIISTAISIGAIAGLIQLANALDAIAAPFEGFGDVLSGLGDTFKGLGKKFKSEAVKNFAISVAILAGAVAVLAFAINKYGWDVALAVGAIAAIATVMVAMSWAVSKFGSAKPTDALKFGAFVLILSTALLMLAGVMAIVGTMKPETLERAGTCFMVFGGVVAAMMASTKLASGKRLKQIGPMIMQVSAAMLLLAWVARIVGGMTWGEMAKAAIGILGFVGLVSALVYVSKFADKNVGKIGGTMLKIAGALLLIVWISSLLNGMEWSELGKAAVGILSLVGVIAALIYVSTYAGYYSDNAGVVLKLAGAITLLALAGKIIASMSWGDMGKAVVGIAGLAAVIAGLIAATKLATDKELKKVSSTLLVMTICIALLAGITVILGLVDLTTLAKGVTAVAILGAIVAGMTYATMYAGDAKGAMIGITIAIVAMVAAVAALSFIDPKKLAVAVTAMTILMGALALVVKSAGMVYGATGPLIVMTVAIALLGGILYGLAQLPTESSLEAAVALGTVLLALAGALRILARVDRTVKDALKAVLALTAMAVPLFAFALVLDRMSATENAVQNALALSVLIGVVSLLMTPLAAIGTVAGNAAIGVALLTAVAVPLFVFVGVLRRMEGLEDSIKNAAALSLLILGMSVTLGVLAIIGPMAAGALAGIASLTLFIGAIGGLMIAVGALSDAWPDLEYFLDTGIGLLNKLGHGIGSFVGNLFSGFADGATNGIEEVGTRLTEFMKNAAGFIYGAKLVNEDVVTGVQALSDAIIAITSAQLISGVGSFLSKGASLSELGSELTEFMKNVAPFLRSIKDVDPEIMTGVKALAEAIVALTATNVLDGLARKFLGDDTNFKDFGQDLEYFGLCMRKFSFAVEGIDTRAIRDAATAGKSIAEMANALPNSGGVAGFFAGENDMDTFGTQLVSFGKSLKYYSLATADLNVESIKASVEATKGIGEMAASIPNVGGVVSWFTGDNDMTKFGEQLLAYGKSLKYYSIMVSTLDTGGISLSVIATNKLSEMAAAIPNMGGVVTWFTGGNDMVKFGEQLLTFGSAIKSYSQTVTGLDTGAISASVSAGYSLAGLADILPQSGGLWSIFSADNDMSTFATEIVSFGSAIKRYSNVVSGIDIYSIRMSISAAEDIVDLINGLKGLDASGIGGFSEAMESLGRVSMAKFVYAFKNRIVELNGVGTDMVTSITSGIQKAQPQMLDTTKNLVEYMNRAIESQNSKFRIAGMTLVTQMALGMRSQNSAITIAVSAPLLSAVTVIRGQYANFYSAGSYVVSGFAKGITANTYKAEASSRAMAIAALDAAKEALGVQSPSKEFYAVGNYSGLGFINALFAYAKKAYNAGAEMGDSATSGVADAIARIKYAIDENVDVQPTIAPVLDLSDIKNGANAINGLLDGTPLNASLGSISTAMNRRNQNGTTNDVVYAINKLRKDLSELDRNSYNIGNVSYEEGSDVANAIQTLVRAAVRERRV